MKRTLLMLAAIAVPGVASAHVVLTQTTARAGAYHAAVFRVGHGCGEAATTAITVRLPDSVPLVRPQPKSGWTVSFGHEALDPPLSDHGRPLTERIRTVTWTGELAADSFDEFALLAKLPSEAGELTFPVVQTCGTTTVAWDGADAAHPAPKLTLTAAPDAAHHP